MKNTLSIFVIALGMLFSGAVFAQDANNSIGFTTDKGAVIGHYRLFQEIVLERQGMRADYSVWKRILAAVAPDMFLKQDSELRDIKDVKRRYRTIRSKYIKDLNKLISSTSTHPATVLLTLGQLYVDAANGASCGCIPSVRAFYKLKEMYEEYKNPISFKVKQMVYYGLKGTPKAQMIMIDPDQIDKMVQDAIDAGYDDLLECTFEVAVGEKGTLEVVSISYDVSGSESHSSSYVNKNTEPKVNKNDKKKDDKKEENTKEESLSFASEDNKYSAVVNLKGGKIVDVTVNGKPVTELSNAGTSYSGIAEDANVDVNVSGENNVTVVVAGTELKASSNANSAVNDQNPVIENNPIVENNTVVENNNQTVVEKEPVVTSNNTTATNNPIPDDMMAFSSADGSVSGSISVKGDDITKVMVGSEEIIPMLNAPKSFSGVTSSGDIANVNINPDGSITFTVGTIELSKLATMKIEIK